MDTGYGDRERNVEDYPPVRPLSTKTRTGRAFPKKVTPPYPEKDISGSPPTRPRRGRGLPTVVRSLSAVLLSLAISGAAFATPEYSARSGQSCKTCHLGEGTGGPLSETGLEFAASGYVWPPTGGYRVLGPIRKSVRFIIGYIHILTAFLWFGTILYVHILLRPAYASKGLPKGEVRLGLASMLIVGISGMLLMVSRIRGLSVLVTSPWGRTLLLKIFLYLIMVASGVLVVRVIGPRLGRSTPRGTLPEDGVFGAESLAPFDGQEGRPAYVALKGKVYDVSGLKLWKGGLHMKHRSGTDLSEAILRAPHGEEKLEAVKAVGTFDPTRPARKTLEQKIFYAVAYVNLGLVFAVLVVIAWWRWGL